jgi:hypothetical protein
MPRLPPCASTVMRNIALSHHLLASLSHASQLTGRTRVHASRGFAAVASRRVREVKGVGECKCAWVTLLWPFQLGTRVALPRLAVLTSVNLGRVWG